MRTREIACGFLLAAIGCGSSGTDEANMRAFRAESRIKAACTQAAGTIDLTLRALETEPKIGFAYATRDAGNALLCGGDSGPVGDAILRGDVPATRGALLTLRSLWCPDCSPPKQ